MEIMFKSLIRTKAIIRILERNSAELTELLSYLNIDVLTENNKIRLIEGILKDTSDFLIVISRRDLSDETQVLELIESLHDLRSEIGVNLVSTFSEKVKIEKVKNKITDVILELNRQIKVFKEKLN
jgi:hypothetical protein